MADTGTNIGNIVGTVIVAGIAVKGMKMISKQLNKRRKQRTKKSMMATRWSW